MVVGPRGEPLDVATGRLRPPKRVTPRLRGLAPPVLVRPTAPPDVLVHSEVRPVLSPLRTGL